MNFLKVKFYHHLFSDLSKISSVHVYELNQDSVSSGQSTPSQHWDNVSDISLYPHDHTSASHIDKICDNHQDETQGTDAICPETK